MREITTRVSINASPEKVWRILVDFRRYPKWNPFMRSIQGEAKKGKRLEVYLKPSGGTGMAFKPVVLSAHANRELRWIGHLLFPGLLDGEHSLNIEKRERGKTMLAHGEKFTGILVPLLFPLIEKSTRRGFTEMNGALKKRAEK